MITSGYCWFSSPDYLARHDHHCNTFWLVCCKEGRDHLESLPGNMLARLEPCLKRSSRPLAVNSKYFTLWLTGLAVLWVPEGVTGALSPEHVIFFGEDVFCGDVFFSKHGITLAE